MVEATRVAPGANANRLTGGATMPFPASAIRRRGAEAPRPGFYSVAASGAAGSGLAVCFALATLVGTFCFVGAFAGAFFAAACLGAAARAAGEDPGEAVALA